VPLTAPYKLSNLHDITPPAFDAPVSGGSRRNTLAMPFGVEKPEWRGYPMVTNFDDTFQLIHFDPTHERDRLTDRQTDTARRHRP